MDGALKENNSIWIGSNPSSSTYSAEYNSAFGVSALSSVTTGINMTAIGYRALKNNTTGSANIAIGFEAL